MSSRTASWRPSCSSASGKEAGVSSDATAFWLLKSHDWKSSMSWRNVCSLLTSPRESSRSFRVFFSASHAASRSPRRAKMSAASSGWSAASRSASALRKASLFSMAAKSLSMPNSFLWMVMTAARSLPRSCVDSMTRVLSLTHDALTGVRLTEDGVERHGVIQPLLPQVGQRHELQEQVFDVLQAPLDIGGVLQLLWQPAGLFGEGVDGGAVLHRLVPQVPVPLQQPLGGVLVVARVVGVHLPLGVQQPGLEVVGVALELEEPLRVEQVLLPEGGQILQLPPLAGDVVRALSDLRGAEVIGPDHPVPFGQHLVQVGAAGPQLVLEGAVLALEQQDARQSREEKMCSFSLIQLSSSVTSHRKFQKRRDCSRRALRSAARAQSSW
ncbi:hypothetical protein EYF80_033242 [Liparis tanakae]|uniref:Uncharacterized protein n=1 Tax=Liparis tanakae TaxID=230148 RepID=A0A4Z2GSN6_9TELE|nr:hypothetical protein EYF80_033242 [Liparis tanakae]